MPVKHEAVATDDKWVSFFYIPRDVPHRSGLLLPPACCSLGDKKSDGGSAMPRPATLSGLSSLIQEALARGGQCGVPVVKKWNWFGHTGQERASELMSQHLGVPGEAEPFSPYQETEEALAGPLALLGLESG